MIEDFATKNRVRITKCKADGTKIVSGRSGQIYEHSERGLAVMFMPRPTLESPWGEWKLRTWANWKRAAQQIGMTVLQDGDSEGCLEFNPANHLQTKLALKIAGVKTKRKVSDNAMAHLKAIGFARTPTLESPSSA